MSRYRKVDPRIWNDEKFRTISDRGKLVFFMLLTHPNMTAIGAMRATVAGLAEELNWELKDFREAFGEVLLKGMAEHDPKACFLALPRFLRYNPPESPNVVKAWASALDLLPECALKIVVIQRAKAFVEGLSEGFREAFAKAMPKTMPIQEQEQEQDKDLSLSLSAHARAKPGTDPPARQRAIALLEFLNTAAGTSYQPLPQMLTPIVSLLGEAARLGYDAATIDEHAKFVIRRCVERWRTEPHMAANLTPQTIFGYEKFWRYHGELGLPGPTAAPREATA